MWRATSFANCVLPFCGRIGRKFPTSLRSPCNINPTCVGSAVPRRERSTDVPLPSQAEIVIAGGGVLGCSVAYHLAKAGWKDILLLEQGSLSGGTTWHAVGLIGKLRGTEVETQISDYAVKCFRTLDEETGQETGFKQTGGMLLARSTSRLTVLKRLMVKARSFGIDVDLISPKEVQGKFPFARVDDLKGALWVPEEGSISPSDLCSSFARAASINGVQIHQKVEVNEVTTDGRRVTGVRTDKGDISCRMFVNCAGMKCNPPVSVPLHAVEHFYIITQPVGASHRLPMLRDSDGHVYFREWSEGICAGGLEPNAKPIFTNGVPNNFEYQLFPEDWDQFEYLMNQILHRIPMMEKTEIRQMVNGPESFTPDGRYLLGEAPNVDNYFVAAGASSTGIANAAGIGRLLSEWITEGRPSLDVSCLDIKRFTSYHNNARFLRDRVKEVVSDTHSLPWPMKEFTHARKLRCSPLYALLDSAGASWGERSGWETANWFSCGIEDHRTNQGTFGRPHWLTNVEREYMACKNGLGLVDLTSTAILEIKGKSEADCLKLLQHLCIDDADIPVSGVLHTGMLNNKGRYELLCTIIRTESNRYLLLTSPSYSTRALSWVARHAGSDVTVTDLASSLSILGVLGPESRDVIQSMTQTPLDNESFPLDTIKTVDIHYSSGVIAIRSSKLAESYNGWQLLVPNDHVTTLYERLKDSGACDVGWYAVNTITAEKGVPTLETEITPHTTPLETDLGCAVRKGSIDFIGKEFLHSMAEKSPAKRLAYMTVDEYDDSNFPWGGETVLYKGDVIGMTTSAVYSFAHACPVCFGFIEKKGQVIEKDFLEGKALEINVAGRSYPVSAHFLDSRLISRSYQSI